MNVKFEDDGTLF